MARDYAKKKTARKKGGASRSQKKQKKPIALIFFAFLLTAGLVALLVYLKWYQPVSTQQGSSQNNSTVKPAVQNKIKPKPAILKSPKKPSDTAKEEKTADDEVPFYRTHQEMMNKTVEIPIEDLKLPEDEHQYSYSMPCGSFRDKARAEELKAQIAFAGYKSKILPVKADSGLWHRVTLGPYPSKRKAESIRHRLQDNNFLHCKIWRKQIK